MATITFEVSKDKTTVSAIGYSGTLDCFDITNTEIEKEFIALLKKIRQDRLLIGIAKVLDIKEWEEY